MGDPVLRAKCEPITEFGSAALLVSDLRESLLDSRATQGMGRSLAAPQIGVQKRAIYVLTPEYEGELLNPRITRFGDGGYECWDSCFSVRVAFFGKVNRWTDVTVEFHTLSGDTRVVEATGKFSELLQHEIDHLDGVLFTDKIRGNGMSLMMREEWEKLGRPFKA